MPARLMLGLGALALVLGAASARAEDQPPLMPTRDVAVTYQSHDPNGGEHTVHMFFDARGQRAHIDVVGGSITLVIDHKDNEVTIINRKAKAYIQQPAPPAVGNLIFRSPNLQFTREGTEKVAGVECTLWKLAPGKGEGGDACITSDGVVLSGQPAGAAASTGVGIKAVKVVYGPQSPSLFVPPPGYKRLQPRAAEPGAPAPAPPPAAPAPAVPNQ